LRRVDPPGVKRVEQGVLASEVVQIDDTSVPVLEAGMRLLREGCLWHSLGDRYRPYIICDCTGKRPRSRGWNSPLMDTVAPCMTMAVLPTMHDSRIGRWI
jgi:hypothetical protein